MQPVKIQSISTRALYHADGYNRPQHMKGVNEHRRRKKLCKVWLPNQGQKRGTKEQDESKRPILTPTATAASVIRRMEIDKDPAAACKKAAENGPDVCCKVRPGSTRTH
jgi:hypothetical protein